MNDIALNILLVEDNPGDVRLFQEAIRGIPSIKVHTIVKTAGEFRDALKTKMKDIDLVFLDLNLPDENGLDIIQDLRNDYEWPQVPILAFSSSRRTEDVIKAYRCGINSYIPKPGTLDTCITILEAVAAFWGQAALLPKQSHDDISQFGSFA